MSEGIFLNILHVVPATLMTLLLVEVLVDIVGVFIFRRFSSPLFSTSSLHLSGNVAEPLVSAHVDTVFERRSGLVTLGHLLVNMFF